MKWRKVKKQFKKNNKKLVGMNLVAISNDDSSLVATISDIGISPAGGKNVRYDFSCIPTQIETRIVEDNETLGIEESSGLYSNKGFSASWEIKMDSPPKELKKLMNM